MEFKHVSLSGVDVDSWLDVDDFGVDGEARILELERRIAFLDAEREVAGRMALVSMCLVGLASAVVAFGVGFAVGWFL